MKGLMRLWEVLALELADWCSADVDRDITHLRQRVEHEGLSFMTITLPAFASDFERSLEAGQIDRTLFRAFRKKGVAPAFLSGFTQNVFDENGLIQVNPDVTCIYAVRQLCLFYKKVEIECSPVRTRDAFKEYLECEQEIKALDAAPTPEGLGSLKATFNTLFGRILADIGTNCVDQFEVFPKHGPGKTADRLSGNQKFTQTVWPERLERVFPYGEYVLPNWSHFDETGYSLLSPSEELPVRVVAVPKTLKTPRIIAIEPTCMQYMQQGLSLALVPRLERDDVVGPLIGFTDQEPNKFMARLGSIHGHLATLDLKEASDRVSNSLVCALLGACSLSFKEAVQATRTRVATVEIDGETHRVRLSKFASMGSALCFPIEAMVFLAIVVDCLAVHLHIDRQDRKAFKRLAGLVRVYGDDIIVPADLATVVMSHLESFGLKVNSSKSFWNGKFRESCGGDYYAGMNVRPIRAKHLLPTSRLDAESCISWSEKMNSFYTNGLYRTSEAIQEHLEEALGPLPYVPVDSNAIGRHFGLPSGKTRMHPSLQIAQVKAWVPRGVAPLSMLSGVFALRKCLASDWSDPEYAEHLQRSGRPPSVNLKKGWVSLS